MTRNGDGGDQWDRLKDSIVGLGERSIRKSYYPELKNKIRDLDQQRSFFQSTAMSCQKLINCSAEQIQSDRCKFSSVA